MKYVAETEGLTFEIDLRNEEGRLVLVEDGQRVPVELEPGAGAVRRCRIGDRWLTFGFRQSGDDVQVVLDGSDYTVRVSDARIRNLAAAGVSTQSAARPQDLKAPIPGRVVRVLVAPGTAVERNQHVMTLDAMKLEYEILAPHAGRIAAVLVEAGQAVEKGQVLLRFEA